MVRSTHSEWLFSIDHIPVDNRSMSRSSHRADGRSTGRQDDVREDFIRCRAGSGGSRRQRPAVGRAAQAQQSTVVSFGGSYQEAQSKALFQPAAKAMGITIKEETYTGIADLRLKVKAGAVTWDIVASGSGSAARAGAEGILEKLDYKVIDVSNFVPGTLAGVLRRRRRVLDGARLEHQDLWRQGAAELGRFLGREEVPGQALLPQGASAGALEPALMADGVAARQGLRGVVGSPAASSARSRRSRS